MVRPGFCERVPRGFPGHPDIYQGVFRAFRSFPRACSEHADIFHGAFRGLSKAVHDVVPKQLPKQPPKQPPA
eukprot:11066922-Lingulodinium_polyedra.AAC.1